MTDLNEDTNKSSETLRMSSDGTRTPAEYNYDNYAFSASNPNLPQTVQSELTYRKRSVGSNNFTGKLKFLAIFPVNLVTTNLIKEVT